MRLIGRRPPETPVPMCARCDALPSVHMIVAGCAGTHGTDMCFRCADDVADGYDALGCDWTSVPIYPEEATP